MSNKKLDRFGKYLLLDHLLDGGMNRIFRARYLGDTASKICAVKVVLPQYSKDPQFKIMFMDEIKVTFGLLHPNIVQTYDYGTHKGQLYVAMEYCDGRNLKEYLDKLKERKFVFPVEISVYIGTQICQGLHYAHTLSDKLTGKDMNIIHRDISPHNIMLTYDGSIKIIDFGIAKAETNSEATQAGTIKGKLSYLAPEYLDGNELDARYDQFAVGITLWEMLCNRKLFKAPNDIAVLKKIQECDVPKPSSINPNVSSELDEIILKSLSKDPSDRYENMDMLNRALIKFLYSKYPDFNATDLSYFAKELFKEDIQKDREKLFDFGKIDLAPYIEDMKIEAKGGEASEETVKVDTTDSGDNSDTTKVKANAVFDFGFSRDSEERTKSGTRILKRKKIEKALSKTPDLSKKDLNLSSFNNASDKKKKERRRVTSSPHETRQTNKTVSRSKINNSSVQEIQRNRKEKKTNYLGKIVASMLVFGGVGYFLISKNVTTEKPRGIASNKSNQVDNVVEENVDEKGRIEFKNLDKYNQKVYLNGKRYSVDVLGFINKIPYGSYYLRVEEANYQNFVELITVNNKNKLVQVTIPKMKFEKFGYLEVSQECFSGEVDFELYGEKRTERVPFVGRPNIAFPVSKEEEFTLYYKATGENLRKKVEFSINNENDVIDFCQLVLH